MKKALLLIFVLVLISPFALAQNRSNEVDILCGEEVKASKRSTLSDIVGYNESGVFVQKDEYNRMRLSSISTLEHYDNDMRFSSALELGEIEFIIHLHDELYVFTSELDKKSKLNILYSQSVDMGDMRLNNDKQEIASVDFSGFSRFNSGSFSYEVSRDSSKLFINYNLPYARNESEKFGFHVFDGGLKEVWHREVTLPYTDQLLSVEDYVVDNNGGVHVVGVEYKDRRAAKKKGNPNYTYHILSYDSKGSSDKPVEVEGKFITDMQIAIDKDLNVLCGGFYSALGTFSIEGSFFLKLDDESNEIVSESFEAFGIDFITQHMSKRKEKKAKKKDKKGKDVEMYEYDLDNIILKDDGGVLIIGEQYFVNTVTTTSTDSNGATRTTTNYYYYYNDIIVISVAPNGDIEWTQKIPKIQITSNDGGFFSSYALSIVADKLYFVFNDNPKNLFYTGEGRIYNFNRGKESLVVLVTLDSDGVQKREALFSMREADILTRPKVCEQISATEMIIFGQRKKSHRLGKIEFVGN